MLFPKNMECREYIILLDLIDSNIVGKKNGLKPRNEY